MAMAGLVLMSVTAALTLVPASSELVLTQGSDYSLRMPMPTPMPQRSLSAQEKVDEFVLCQDDAKGDRAFLDQCLSDFLAPKQLTELERCLGNRMLDVTLGTDAIDRCIKRASAR